MGKQALTCPSCHRACHEPHCKTKSCPWKVCHPCELILGVPYGRMHAISERASA